MRQIIVLLILFFTLTSWKADKNGPWIITKGKRIVLHSRPLGYSKAESPDSIAIQTIIQEQEHVIDYINKILNTNFDSKVKIFLFNQDEAKEKIGTNGGGFASLNKFKRHIYFTFHSKPYLNTVLNKYDYLGAHEMVHIITINQLGNLRTSFFGEGYSNAIDGNYGCENVNGILTRRRNDSTLIKIKENGKLLKPSDLLYNETIPESLYYPQIGCLINWMFEKYGVDKINLLYDLKRDKIEQEFLKIIGQKFKDMELEYMDYLKNK
ncbi:MAG: hypothetical protein H3C40_14205 [Ignavibacterium sp.]|nr:hypothetical protein [Ignavibacterium sp.]